MKKQLWMNDVNGKPIAIGDYVMVFCTNLDTGMLGKVRSLKRCMGRTTAKLIWSDGSPSTYSYKGSDLKIIGVEDIL